MTRSTAVAAVVVTHGPHPDLAECLAALHEQVDEIVVVANLHGPAPALPPGARLLQNTVARGYAANANRGIDATSAPFVVLSNPDAVPTPGAIDRLVRFAAEHPAAGVIGPKLVYRDGSWQASRRRFPTVWGTVVRRTPLRLVLPPERFAASHYLDDEGTHEPVAADWMLGAFLFLRRSMLDELAGLDAGYRLYGEEIDLCYRAAKAGWDRWYVPEAVVVHRFEGLTDHRFLTRRTLWHLAGVLRFVRKHPERLRALR
ncbi:MAG: glycosyltransferase [Acidimicrobiales bacterium]